MAKAAADKTLKNAEPGPSVGQRQHDSARRGFLIGSTLAATSFLMPPVIKAAKLLHSSSSTHDSALSVLGAAYAGLAANYRLQAGTLAYTARELRCRVEGHAFTRFELKHVGKSGGDETEQIATIRQEIQKLALGMEGLAAETLTGEKLGFQPTMLLYQGRVYTDESLLQAARPLCAVVENAHRINSSGTPVRAITLSAKGRATFHPQVVIA